MCKETKPTRMTRINGGRNAVHIYQKRLNAVLELFAYRQICFNTRDM